MVGFEILLEIATIIIGIVAVIITFNATRRLTGGMVRSYIIWIGSALILVIIGTTFHMINTLNLFDETYPYFSADTFHTLYHIFLIIGFIFFAIASYRLNKMSELYGFKEEGKHINQSTRKRPPRSH
ncbi:MAG: hypothetical protein GQ533_11095 [Methanosarcinaceae archaeon]|nr:hypothetical protein [Methanosarcinaceae archaeon]